MLSNDSDKISVNHGTFFLLLIVRMRHTFNSGCYFWYLRTHAYDQFWVQSPNWFIFIKLRINFWKCIVYKFKIVDIFPPSWNIMWTTNRNVHTDYLDKRNGYRVRCMRSSEWILNRALCVIRPLYLKMEYFFGHFWAVNKTILCIKIGEYTGSGKWKHTLQKTKTNRLSSGISIRLESVL